MAFRDRSQAGQILAEKLSSYRGCEDLLVLALPRGGVPVAFEVAKTLQVPLDVFVVRKLGVPGREELAMGAIASGGILVLNKKIVDGLRIPNHTIQTVAGQEWQELQRREREYRGERTMHPIAGETVILVDDGLATGATMRAAAQAVRQQQPRRIVVAVPVSAADTCDEFRTEVDEIVCAVAPEEFHAVGSWYEDFRQLSDNDVTVLLNEAEQFNGKAVSHAGP